MTSTRTVDHPCGLCGEPIRPSQDAIYSSHTHRYYHGPRDEKRCRRIWRRNRRRTLVAS